MPNCRSAACERERGAPARILLEHPHEAGRPVASIILRAQSRRWQRGQSNEAASQTAALALAPMKELRLLAARGALRR